MENIQRTPKRNLRHWFVVKIHIEWVSTLKFINRTPSTPISLLFQWYSKHDCKNCLQPMSQDFMAKNGLVFDDESLYIFFHLNSTTSWNVDRFVRFQANSTWNLISYDEIFPLIGKYLPQSYSECLFVSCLQVKLYVLGLREIMNNFFFLILPWKWTLTKMGFPDRKVETSEMSRREWKTLSLKFTCVTTS